MSALSIVNQYLDAFYSGDFDRAKPLVANDFHFQGPFVEATDKETFFKSAIPLAQIARGHLLLRQWAESDEVCSIFDVKLETPAGKLNEVTNCSAGEKLDTGLPPDRAILLYDNYIVKEISCQR